MMEGGGGSFLVRYQVFYGQPITVCVRVRLRGPSVMKKQCTVLNIATFNEGTLSVKILN